MLKKKLHLGIARFMWNLLCSKSLVFCVGSTDFMILTEPTTTEFSFEPISVQLVWIDLCHRLQLHSIFWWNYGVLVSNAFATSSLDPDWWQTVATIGKFQVFGSIFWCRTFMGNSGWICSEKVSTKTEFFEIDSWRLVGCTSALHDYVV
jgi:hypothetical protein